MDFCAPPSPACARDQILSPSTPITLIIFNVAILLLLRSCHPLFPFFLFRVAAIDRSSNFGDYLSTPPLFKPSNRFFLRSKVIIVDCYV